MSARPSTASPSAISGAMYAGVPGVRPAAVAIVCSPIATFVGFTSPKSSTFTKSSCIPMRPM